MMGAFRKAESGAAAVEFAMLLPILITLFFGVVETTLALVCRADVSLMAATSADLISQVNAASSSATLSASSRSVLIRRPANARHCVASANCNASTIGAKRSHSQR